MRRKAMIYIAVAVIVLVVLAGLIIYNHTESSDTEESVNATQQIT